MSIDGDEARLDELIAEGQSLQLLSDELLQHATFDVTSLQEIFSLAAYDNIASCPAATYLDERRRHEVADVVNAALLGRCYILGGCACVRAMHVLFLLFGLCPLPLTFPLDHFDASSQSHLETVIHHTEVKMLINTCPNDLIASKLVQTCLQTLRDHDDGAAVFVNTTSFL
jgi:hypothetical protein